VRKPQEFINENAIYDFIFSLTPDKAREIGIKHRSALAYLKKKENMEIIYGQKSTEIK
jgi:hypothetical protein